MQTCERCCSVDLYDRNQVLLVQIPIDKYTNWHIQPNGFLECVFLEGIGLKRGVISWGVLADGDGNDIVELGESDLYGQTVNVGVKVYLKSLTLNIDHNKKDIWK